MRLTIGARLTGGMLAGALITLGVGIIALLAIDKTASTANDLVDIHVEEMGVQEKLTDDLQMAQRYDKEFLLFHETGDEDKRREYLEKLTAAWDELERDGSRIDDLPAWAAPADLVSEVLRLLPQTRAGLDAVVELLLAGRGYDQVQPEYLAYRDLVLELEGAVARMLAAQEVALEGQQSRLVDMQGTVRMIVGATLVAAVVIAVLIGRLLTRSIVVPVARLTAVTRRVAAGDLMQRVDISSGDELGDLADSFNQMTGSLLEFRQEIEQKQEEMSHANWELRAADERYRVLLDLGGKVGEAVVMTQTTERGEGIQTFVSDEWPSITGYARKELLGMSFFDLLPPDHQADFRARHEKLMAGAIDPGLFEMTVTGKHGVERPIELTCGHTVYRGQRAVVSYIRDITERKRTDAQLRETVVALTRSNDDLQQFAYVASHDLQEPLRMVGSYVQLLSRRYKGKLDQDADDFIGFAVDGAMRMQRMINDLLTYSRVGTQGGDLQPTDCEDVLRQAVGNLQLAIEESGASVTHDRLPTVLADESQMVQLLQNLIANAVRFQGEEPARIHVDAERRNGDWLFRVSDNGPGIEPQHHERIFQVFQRCHDGSYPGTGIGLAICRRVVDRHGGRIWVESEPGRGSDFLFTIPATEGDIQS